MPLPQCVPSGNGPSRPRGRSTQGFWGTCSWMGVCRSRDAAKPNRWLCALHSALWQARSSFRSGSCTLPSTSSWLDCSESRLHLILLFPFPLQRRKQPEWEKVWSERATEWTPEVLSHPGGWDAPAPCEAALWCLRRHKPAHDNSSTCPVLLLAAC